MLRGPNCFQFSTDFSTFTLRISAQLQMNINTQESSPSRDETFVILGCGVGLDLGDVLRLVGLCCPHSDERRATGHHQISGELSCLCWEIALFKSARLFWNPASPSRE
mmetsp:Transcript_10023/g.22523  ORF Transcript_10023/g.22523 Transcript_10023/m.22523 type:complete len:108 (+) Transcript_10023:549-872(+)